MEKGKSNVPSTDSPEKIQGRKSYLVKRRHLGIYNDELQTGLPRMLALDALLQELSILPFPRPQDKYNSKKSLSSVCRSITSIYQRDDDIRMQELILKLFHSQTA